MWWGRIRAFPSVRGASCGRGRRCDDVHLVDFAPRESRTAEQRVRYSESTIDVKRIGEFARPSPLSAKALRLYELSVLPPARVDPESGYRSTEAGQLEQA